MMGMYDAQEASIRRQQMIAKALRDSGNQGFDPAASAGRLVYARSPWEDINKVAQQATAAYLDSRAEKRLGELQDQRKADEKTRLAGMVDTLAGKSQNVLNQPNDPALSPLSGDVTVRNPVTGANETVGVGTEMNTKRAGLAAILKGADPEEAVTMLQGKALEKALPTYEKVDMGGQLGWADSEGNIVRTVDKSATKDAILGADTTRYGINVGRQNNIDDNATSRANNAATVGASYYATNTSRDNNILDNATSRANTADTVAASRYNADRDFEAAKAKLEAEVGKGQKITVDERKAAYLATRLKNAQTVFDDLRQKNPDALGANWAAEAVRGIPAVGEFAANMFSSSDRQRADAAQRDALDAAITLATGAAYTKEQLEAARRSHFAMPGDSDAVKIEKKARLDALVSAAELAAGNAVGNVAPVTDAFKATLEPAVKITSDDEYNKLPPRTRFIGPDGQERVKP